MCDVSRIAMSRRGLLRSAGALTGAAMSPMLFSGSASTADTAGDAARYNTRLVLLGTSGGPIWWEDSDRSGISSAIVIGDAKYVVDCGDGAGHSLRKAGLLGQGEGQNDLHDLRGVFLTHLHSDHISDYPALLLHGFVGGGLGRDDRPVQVHGPGRRGTLPEVFPPDRPEPDVVNPGNPWPGTADMTSSLIEAFATDINDRIFDSGAPDIRARVQAHDIVLPEGAGADPNAAPPRLETPVEVYEDDRVKVTATLVDHGQVFPSFGYRFDTEDGSVVFSGDTTVSDNLIDLAANCNLLVHEVVDEAWVRESIEGLPEPQPIKDAYINHMLGAHTTIEQVGGVAEEAGAGTLVLNHFVPGNLPAGRWQQAGKDFSGRLIIGADLMHIGVGRKHD